MRKHLLWQIIMESSYDNLILHVIKYHKKYKIGRNTLKIIIICISLYQKFFFMKNIGQV